MSQYMTEDVSTRQSTLAHWSTDLVIVLCVTLALTVAIFVPGISETALRIPLGLAFAFFIPGYAFVAAVYPERYSPPQDGHNSDTGLGSVPTGSTLTDLERCLLAVAFSVVVVPFVGYLLDIARIGVQLVPFVLAICVSTILMTLIAGVRRWRLPAERRFRVAIPAWLVPTRSQLGGYNDVPTLAVSILLVVSVAFFAASVGYAATSTTAGDQYSELTLLNENGETFADNATAETGTNETPQDVWVSVRNHEGQTMSYTVVVVEQTLSEDGGEWTVDDQTERDRFELTADNNEMASELYTIPSTTAGDQTRLVWLLYSDNPPASPSTENAPYYVYVWLSGDDETALAPSTPPEESDTTLGTTDTQSTSDL